jgi:hypothetical protein
VNPFEFVKFDMTDDGFVNTITVVGDPDLDAIEIGSNQSEDIEEAKAAVSAFLDALVHGLYDHELTDPYAGIIIRADAKLNALYASNLGWVFPDYDGNLVPRLVGQTGRLHRRLNKWVVSPLRGRNSEPTDRRADYVRAALLGHGLVARVRPLGDWPLAIIENLSIEDDDERAQDAADRKFRAARRRQRYQKTRKMRGQVEAGEVKVPDSITMRVFGSDDEFVDICELPSQMLKVHPRRGLPEPRVWDGSVTAKLDLAILAASGYEVELGQ